MFTESEQFITRMKLRELRKQRQMLQVAYDRLDQQLAGADSEAGQLSVLYDGLRRISFAGQKLHGEVANLEPLLYSLSGSQASPDTLAFWRDKLEKELSGGRLRAEIVFIFAALLEEWTQESSATPADSENARIRAELLAEVTAPDPISTIDQAFLDRLFEAIGLDGDSDALLEKLTERVTKRRIVTGEVEVTLRKIAADRYQASGVRRQAQSLADSALMLKEFTDALNLILNEFEDWNWPSEGVTVVAKLTPSKWRLFLNEDLPTVCLLEVLGGRWQRVFKEFFEGVHATRFQQVRKSVTSLPPARRVEEVLKFYRASFGIEASVYNQIDLWSDDETVREGDLWEDPESIEERVKFKKPLEDLMRLWATHDSILGQRATLKKSQRDLTRLNAYSQGSRRDNELGPMEQALTQINAELRLGQTAFPTRPLYILKADLKNYYPALSHELLLEILGRFGLSDEHLEFFRRYLQVTIKEGQGVVTARRGLLIHRYLADLLAELVMLLLDYHVQRSARVQIVRMIDDICLIAASPEEAAKAWQSLEEFCAATGLSLNREKCGAVGVGDSQPLPAGLPAAQPNWAMVTLDNQGRWSIDPRRFETYLEQVRGQVTAANSLIARAEIYNNSLNYLVQALGMKVRLGDSHRDSVGQTLLRFQNDFFGPGQGIVGELRRLIRERFLGQDSASADQLPDGWLHWPITAGGLSLYHPLILATSYAQNYHHSRLELFPEERKRDWQRRRNDWYSFYRHLLSEIDPTGPNSNQVMETLVKDFIQRGSEISLGNQHDLSNYWRWVVYIYGPQILDRLGTFRFLLTDLVPAQLITGKYRQGLDDDEGDEDSDDPFQIPF